MVECKYSDKYYSSFAMNRGIFLRSLVWEAFDVWAGAPSCWKINDSPLNMFRLRFFTTGSKINSQYVLELIFTPAGTNISGVRPTADIPAQTITESGFWTRGTYFNAGSIVDALWDMILSFWGFNASSIVRIFSSEKSIFSKSQITCLTELSLAPF